MRTFSLAFLCILIVAALGCGKKPGGEAGPVGGAGSTPDNIDGTYKLVALTEEGKVYISFALEEKVHEKRRTWTFKDGRVTMEAGSPLSLPFKLDATKSPGWIDVISPGTKKGDPDIGNYGIYMVDGDSLTISMTSGMTNKPEDRPKEFKSGSKYATRKFKRQ